MEHYTMTQNLEKNVKFVLDLISAKGMHPSEMTDGEFLKLYRCGVKTAMEIRRQYPMSEELRARLEKQERNGFTGCFTA